MATRSRYMISPPALFLALACLPVQAQHSPDARTLVERAVQVELAADRDDHSIWHYRMSEKAEDNSLYEVIETHAGSVRRKLEQAGHPLSGDEQRAETEKIESFVHDPRAQARQRRDGEHDDESAAKMLNLLPRAFTWSVAGENGTSVTLHFVPDPNFRPPDIESRVLSAMEGDLVVDRSQQRITTIRGRLAHEVVFGLGMFGRLREGGTFNVERRQLAPGVWQITETHIHIEGRALLFKTIGQQTDEIKFGFQPVPPATTLEQAAAMLAAR